MSIVRHLSDEEVAGFRSTGWTHVPGLVSREFAGRLLERAKAVMGEDGLKTLGNVRKSDVSNQANMLRRRVGMWKIEPLMFELSHDPVLAQGVSRLLRGHPVRFFADGLLVKPPREAGGMTTPWHQDLPHMAFDRTGLVSIWISLVDLPPEGGAMSFVNGSHRYGPLGRTLLDRQDVVSQNPWVLEENGVEPAPAMKAGDATIHSDLTIHCGPAFDGPHWRWAYLVNLMDATIRYGGATGLEEENERLSINRPYPDDRYPITGGVSWGALA